MTKSEAQALGAHCHLCPLNKEGIIVPPAPPRGKLRLVIVGEGPGKTEEKLGAPFVGLSGKLLDKTLGDFGFNRRDAHVTNAALCRGENDKDNQRAAECCGPRLLSELQGLHPEAPILALGAAASRSLLGARGILVARGFIWTAKSIDAGHVKGALKKAYKLPPGAKRDNEILKGETLAGRAALAGRKVIPALHPAFILRADTWHPIFRIDVNRAVRLSSGEINVTEDIGTHAVGGVELLRGFSPVVSLDVETDGVDSRSCKLLCVGISDLDKTVVIWPWKKRYASRLQRFLESRERVVCHNLAFDVAVLRAHGVE